MQDAAVGAAQSPGNVVLDEINLRIDAGDFWVVGGLPGSGKTDLLATMAGMQRPARGALRLFGMDADSMIEAELSAARRRLGLVFEHGGRLFNNLTVAENVALPLHYHKDWPTTEILMATEKALSSMDLMPLAHATPGQIKQAARQRAALARALTLRPEVLLLDNPLAGLGPHETRWWRDFLNHLSRGHELLDRKPLTLLVTCDDFRPWADQATQFALLQGRRLRPLGGRAELARSKEPLLSELLAAEFSKD